MPTFKIKANDLPSIRRELDDVFRKHNAERRTRVRHAVVRAAISGKKYVERYTIPVAFAELVESLTVQLERGPHASIVVSAPHAEAVEVGSRPHMPPLEPLIKWVKLRGMQGLATGRQRKKLRGSTTRWHASRVATLIKAHERKGGVVPIDAAEQVARAIQMAIAQRGTKPQRYMMKAIPFVEDALFEEVCSAVPDR